MHPKLRIIAPALVAFSFGACFDFDATMAGGPFADGGSDGPPDAGVTESASAEAGDATEESSEAAPHDAGIDDQAAGPFCKSMIPPDGGIFFCDDFDEHALPGSWATWAESSGSLVETDASAASPPNSVVETTTALADGQTLDVALRTPLPVPALPATLLLSFSLQPVQIDTSANAAIVLAAVDFLDGAGYRYTVGLAINVTSAQPALALGEQYGVASGGNFPDGAPPTFVNHPLPPTDPLPMNAWTDIVIELDWTSSSLEGKVTVGGNEEFDVPLAMTVVPSSLQIGIGTTYVTEYDGGLSPVWELRYDNVLFTAH